MELFTKSVKNSHFVIIGLITLVLQNIAIFFNHYFNGFGFRWDFIKAYFVTPAFWTTAIDLGIFPQWNPYQLMGYPLFMKATSSFHYPLVWLFPLFSIPYTLQAAVIFQILHILLGSIGMFFFLKHVFKSPKYAIIGAVAFQFFGGFYANSEHLDIVRGFVLVPWLFYVFTLNMDKPAITKKILFIPIVVFFIATGAYPGIFISTVFIMTIFIILQTLNLFSKGFGKRKSLTIGGSLFGLLLLGLVLSVIHLGPFIQFGDDELPRFSEDRSRLPHNILTIEQFPGFFMSNTAIPGEPSMTSTFLTLPILIFASFITWAYIKKFWILFVIFAIGILMSFGNQTPFWTFLTSEIPILEFSIRPASDYRIFVALPILVFAISGLKSIFERQITLRSFIFRIPFILSWFGFGIILLQNNIEGAKFANFEDLSQQINFSIVILGITFFILIISMIKLKGFSFRRKPYEISTIALIIITLIILANGFLTISDMYTWLEKPYDKIYVRAGIPLEKNGKLITYSILENIPETRPEREITEKRGFPWKGVLTGSYMMQDSGHNELKSNRLVESNKIYMDYMFMKWTPIFLDPPINVVSNKIVLNEKIFSQIDSDPKTSVTQTYYGINDINYKVFLDEPKLMVENEIYFQGWTATLYFLDHEEQLQAIEVNDAFRGWILPAGEYEMKASFEFPNYTTYQMISFSALIVWVIVLVAYVLKFRTRHIENYNQESKSEN